MGIEREDKGASKGDLARSHIKDTARHLFARYGIDTVTIRDIAKAAGQRNGGSVNYYFRSKEDLIREIIDDGARTRDIVSGERLDEIEASGATLTIRGLLKANFLPADTTDVEEMRLFTMLQTYRRDLMHTQIPDRWDGSFRRCVNLLRPLLPDYGEVVLRQRLYFLVPYIWTFLATREAIEGQAEFWKKFWADPAAIEGLFDTAEAILTALPSAETKAAMSAG